MLGLRFEVRVQGNFGGMGLRDHEREFSQILWEQRGSSVLGVSYPDSLLLLLLLQLRLQ